MVFCLDTCQLCVNGVCDVVQGQAGFGYLVLIVLYYGRIYDVVLLIVRSRLCELLVTYTHNI